MGEKVNFIDKVLTRIDRLDRESIQGYLANLAQERKRMEQVLDQIEEGILVLDSKGIVKFSNRRAYSWLGFPRFLKDRSHIEGLVEEPVVQRFIRDRLKSPHESVAQEFEVLAPRELFLRIHWIPLNGANGREILVRIENLTSERNRGEEDARAQRVEGLIRLASGVAHEIGNPLNSIQIHLELMKKEIAKLPPAKQKGLDRPIEVMASETRRLDQIVRSFLRATRKPPLRFRKESVNEILEEAVNFLRPEMKKRKVSPQLDLDRNLPEFLVDRDRLHQAFLNLLKNAIEAMPKGGEIRVSTRFKERLCMIRLQDEGAGIDEKDLPHIFEAYYTTKEEGSGLGLSQVYQTVREQGGRIEVETRLGKGSVFTIILPIRQERLSLPGVQKSPVGARGEAA